MLHQQQQTNMAFQQQQQQQQQYNNDDLKQTLSSSNEDLQDIETSWIQPFIRIDHDDDIGGDSFEGEGDTSFSDGNPGGFEKELGLMEIFASKLGGGGDNSMTGEDQEVDLDFHSFRMHNDSGKLYHDSFSTIGMNDARLTDDFELSQEEEEEEEEDRLDGTGDELSVASLSQAFEKLTSCMERTSQTREMIRLAGLMPNAAAPPSTTMTTTLPNAEASSTTFQHSSSAPNLIQLQGTAPPRKSRSSNKLLDLLDSRSNHSTESGFRSRGSPDSATSLSSLGSKSKRTGGGIAKGRRRMRKLSNPSSGGGGGVASGGVSASVIGGPGLMKRSVHVSSSGPLPKNVRLSMSTRKQLLKDLRSKKNKSSSSSSSSSSINNRSSSSLPLFTVR